MHYDLTLEKNLIFFHFKSTIEIHCINMMEYFSGGGGF